MQLNALSLHSQIHIPNPKFIRQFSQRSIFFKSLPILGVFGAKICQNMLVKIIARSDWEQEIISDGCRTSSEVEDNGYTGLGSLSGAEEEVVEAKRSEELANGSIWKQMKEIVMFSGPATGLWICGPLMSLISTAVIGQGSSTEIAALGPGSVFCDNMSILFMFLSIATSNMVATSLAKQDKKEVQHQISVLLFVGLTLGVLMVLFTQFLSPWALIAFTGPKNVHIVPTASKYVQIRGIVWTAILFGLVAQSATLGMKDSLGPLKALVVSSAVNGVGHVVLRNLLHYGIVGAAWATMASQVVAAYMMIETLNKKGYNAFLISVPSPNEFLQIFALAAPVFVTMFSKVANSTFLKFIPEYFHIGTQHICEPFELSGGILRPLTYFATTMGTLIVAAHQVMIQMYGMCVVWGEPLSQTAQSFMPELLYGVEKSLKSLKKARMLLKSLLIIGAILGLTIEIIGMSIPWLLPNLFTSDPKVVLEVHKVLILFFLSLSVTPCTHSLEGTLLARRDFKFISLSMSRCFSFGAFLLLLLNSKGYGLTGCWFALVGFQWARFFVAFSSWHALHQRFKLEAHCLDHTVAALFTSMTTTYAIIVG